MLKLLAYVLVLCASVAAQADFTTGASLPLVEERGKKTSNILLIGSEVRIEKGDGDWVNVFDRLMGYGWLEARWVSAMKPTLARAC